jgi:hypothetical protein
MLSCFNADNLYVASQSSFIAYHILQAQTGTPEHQLASGQFNLQLRILHDQLRPVEGASFQTLEVFGKHLTQQHYTALLP